MLESIPFAWHLVGVTVTYVGGSKASTTIPVPGTSSEDVVRRAANVARKHSRRPVEDVTCCYLGPAPDQSPVSGQSQYGSAVTFDLGI